MWKPFALFGEKPVEQEAAEPPYPLAQGTYTTVSANIVTASSVPTWTVMCSGDASPMPYFEFAASDVSYLPSGPPYKRLNPQFQSQRCASCGLSHEVALSLRCVGCGAEMKVWA